MKKNQILTIAYCLAGQLLVTSVGLNIRQHRQITGLMKKSLPGESAGR